MFGYVTVYDKELKIRDYETYRSYYCGLCSALKKQYGRTGQMLLNYDMTFLLMLLSGLYEPKERSWEGRCAPHPLRPHTCRVNRFTEYAADMTVLLAWEKAKDDWDDEHSVRGGILEKTLRAKAQKIAQRWPRQAKSLRENIDALTAAQEAGEDDIDLVSGFTGRFLSEIFVYKEDAWQQSLRRVGFYLGKFIYLMDAWEDLEKDRKNGNYNLFLLKEQKGQRYTKDEVKEILADMMANCCSAFEHLPALAHDEILRNILYAGVWVKFR